jgi:5S rRNA maturation endonuclease (ribonuclease M5)
MNCPINTWKGLPCAVLVDAGVVRDGGLVRIPYRLADGGLYAERVVAPSGRRWWAPGDGRPMIPFGLERLTASPHDRGLLVAEGESDALALRAWFGWGYDVLGIPGATAWRAQWRRHLLPYAAIYVFGDGDAAGREMAFAICRDFPRVRTVPVPDREDVRSLLEREGPGVIDELLGEADRLSRVAASLGLQREDVDADAA